MNKNTAKLIEMNSKVHQITLSLNNKVLIKKTNIKKHPVHFLTPKNSEKRFRDNLYQCLIDENKNGGKNKKTL